MDDFERTCIQLMVRGGLLEADIERQLPFVTVADRVHDADGRHTVFRVSTDAPVIIPRDAALAADVVVAGIGDVTVYLDINDGLMDRFEVHHPPTNWPREPRVLGHSEYPEP